MYESKALAHFNFHIGLDLCVPFEHLSFLRTLPLNLFIVNISLCCMKSSGRKKILDKMYFYLSYK